MIITDAMVMRALIAHRNAKPHRDLGQHAMREALEAALNLPPEEMLELTDEERAAVNEAVRPGR